MDLPLEQYDVDGDTHQRIMHPLIKDQAVAAALERNEAPRHRSRRAAGTVSGPSVALDAAIVGLVATARAGSPAEHAVERTVAHDIVPAPARAEDRRIVDGQRAERDRRYVVAPSGRPSSAKA